MTDELKLTLEHAKHLRGRIAELGDDDIIEADGCDVVVLADEIERIRPRLAALEAFAASAKHLIGQTCYEYDDAPDAWNATADAWAALEATGPVLKPNCECSRCGNAHYTEFQDQICHDGLITVWRCNPCGMIHSPYRPLSCVRCGSPNLEPTAQFPDKQP